MNEVLESIFFQIDRFLEKEVITWLNVATDKDTLLYIVSETKHVFDNKFERMKKSQLFSDKELVAVLNFWQRAVQNTYERALERMRANYTF